MKRLLVLTVLCSLSVAVLGQKGSFTAYLDQAFNETSKRKALYVRNMEQVDATLYKAEVRGIEDKVLKMEGEYVLDNANLKEHGLFTFYYPNGTVESRGEYHNGYKVGPWERYTSSGVRRPDRYYDPDRTQLLDSITKK